ncbi:hypothetical protein JHK87_048079 [Glycine soja]|nr:hypothetical protein JHK87_048079 [Glycine soja]
MSRKQNLLCELHTKKGTWKIVVRITDMWRLNKHNGRQSIEMVLMDHTGTKIGATLWQELFPEFEPKLRCGGAYVIQNMKVVDTHSDYKVNAIKYLVYFVKTTSVKEVDRPEIPPNVHAITSFADIISGVAKPDTLVVIERKTVNSAYRVTVKLRDNSHVEIFMTMWEEYALQLDDAIEKNHFVQKPLVVILTLAKIKEPKDDEGGVSQSQSTQNCQDKFLHNAQIVSFGEIKTLQQSGDEIKVFPACVDQLLGKTWVSSEYDPGNAAFVTPAKRTSDQQGSSQFDSDDFTTYELSTNKHIKDELVYSAREYVFTVDVDNRMIVRLYPLVLPLDVVGYVNAGDDYVTVLGVRGHHHFWKLSMHNGLKCFAEPWFQFLTENDLMASDEVVFYFKPNQLLWEVIARKQTVWDEDEDDSP